MATEISNFVYKNLSQTPLTGNDFPVLNEGGNGMEIISIPPNDILTPHWHPNATETTYCLSGEGSVTIIKPDNHNGPIGSKTYSYTFKAGDVVVLPQGYAHYFENNGANDFKLLLTFDNPNFDILTLADTIKGLPENIIKAVEKSAAECPAKQPLLSV